MVFIQIHGGTVTPFFIRPLQGRYQGPGNSEMVNRSVNLHNKDISAHTSLNLFIHSVEELAKKRGLTMAQVALAWCFSKPGMAMSVE